MKKTKSLIVALASIAMLAACGGTNSNSSSSKDISENVSISSSKKDEASSSNSIAPESSAPASSSKENPTSSSSTSEAHVHTFGDWVTTKEPTHAEEGQKERTCACGAKETEKISRTLDDHTYGEWETLKLATCTEKGLEKRTCCYCGNIETRETPILDHTVVEDASVSPTCNSVGYTSGSHCSVCGTVIDAQQEIAKREHIWREKAEDNAHLKNTP
ncbi:MAG: hypothetical protein MJ238_05740, partial [Bacilli bacterium]|nr:hypothetical protein [Bacilli bacterium]